jgi:hypothetical protein
MGAVGSSMKCTRRYVVLYDALYLRAEGSLSLALVFVEANGYVPRVCRLFVTLNRGLCGS